MSDGPVLVTAFSADEERRWEEKLQDMDRQAQQADGEWVRGVFRAGEMVATQPFEQLQVGVPRLAPGQYVRLFSVCGSVHPVAEFYALHDHGQTFVVVGGALVRVIRQQAAAGLGR